MADQDPRRIVEIGPPPPTPEQYGRLDKADLLLKHLNLEWKLVQSVREVFSAVQDTGLKGSVTVRIDIVNDDAGIVIRPHVVVKTPTHPITPKIVYGDDDGYPAILDPHVPVLTNHAGYEAGAGPRDLR